ncbi:MAG: pyrroloquinoline quinone biosynthesis peptide chaperone PqqD [Gammaproteobacteria bacterium]
MNETVNKETVPAIAPGLRFQWEEAQDCHVLLYPEGMIKLSPSAGEILRRCDGQKTIDDIIAELNEQFPDADLADDVMTFLEKAVENGWIRT